jgi:GT2 family glycosyltransferase
VRGDEPTPEVSVVIVNWNARGALLDCLHSLKTYPPSVAWEAIVVDNASSDGSVEAVRADAPWARIIANDANVGLAAANNQGLSAARGRSILICNPDIVLKPGTVDALLDVLARRARAAFVVARLVHPDGTLQTSAGDLPTLGDALLGRQLARRRAEVGAASGFWWDGWNHDEERTIGHGAEACYLVRADAVVQIGPQDDGYVLDWEGLDWSERAWAAGWEVWFCPAAEAIHLGGVSIRQVPVRWVVQSHRGMYRYFRSRRSRAVRPLLWLAFASRATAKAIAAAAGVRLHERALRGS